ncbi:MAG: twin-arginine translocase subunit TatC [Phycisphaerales bacterium]
MPTDSGLLGLLLSPYESQVQPPSPDGSAAPGAGNATSLLPVLTTDPPTPIEGQAWIKQPEGQLRIHSNGRTQVFIPLASQSMLAPMIEIDQYISFVTTLMLSVVVSFQLPVVMMILGWTGLIDPKFLSKYRRHCVFTCFVLGAILTPADPLSMFALAIPLWGLYELGLLVMRMGYRKKADKGGEPA